MTPKIPHTIDRQDPYFKVNPQSIELQERYIEWYKLMYESPVVHREIEK